MAHRFEPFFTTKAAQSGTGSGQRLLVVDDEPELVALAEVLGPA